MKGDKASHLQVVESQSPSFVTERVRGVPPSGIRRFFDLIASTEGVISLGVGEPDFPTPWHIREQAVYAIERGWTTYTANAGLPELRRTVAEAQAKRRGLSYDPDREVMVTVGVSEGIDLALRALLNPGDEVLVPEPSFVAYSPCVTFAGGRPVPVPLEAGDGFRFQARSLRQALSPRTKAVILCSPNNPTGTVVGAQELEALSLLAREHSLLVLADEIYSDLTYERPYRSIATWPGMQERTLVLDGLSKAYAMTGWRIGYALGPADLIGAMIKIHQYTMMSAPTVAQYAAVEALRNGVEERERMREAYARRRNWVLHRLAELGLPCVPPAGAFYVFPSIRETGLSSEAFSEALLEAEKVAVVPGNAFGVSGEGHIRCSYAVPLPILRKAFDCIERFLASQTG